MAIAIKSAVSNGSTLTLTVCPAYTAGACQCADPAASHRLFQFGTDQDQTVSAREALRIVEAEQAAVDAPVAALAGMTL